MDETGGNEASESTNDDDHNHDDTDDNSESVSDGSSSDNKESDVARFKPLVKSSSSEIEQIDVTQCETEYGEIPSHFVATEEHYDPGKVDAYLAAKQTSCRGCYNDHDSEEEEEEVVEPIQQRPLRLAKQDWHRRVRWAFSETLSQTKSIIEDILTRENADYEVKINKGRGGTGCGRVRGRGTGKSKSKGGSKI